MTSKATLMRIVSAQAEELARMNQAQNDVNQLNDRRIGNAASLAQTATESARDLNERLDDLLDLLNRGFTERVAPLEGKVKTNDEWNNHVARTIDKFEERIEALEGQQDAHTAQLDLLRDADGDPILLAAVNDNTRRICTLEDGLDAARWEHRLTRIETYILDDPTPAGQAALANRIDMFMSTTDDALAQLQQRLTDLEQHTDLALLNRPAPWDTPNTESQPAPGPTPVSTAPDGSTIYTDGDYTSGVEVGPIDFDVVTIGDVHYLPHTFNEVFKVIRR